MIELAHVLYWCALGGFLAGTLSFSAYSIFGRPALVAGGVAVSLAGFLALTCALALRWIESGHGPYLGRYEALGSYAWALTAAYLVLALASPRVKAAGVVVLPVALLLLGGGVLSPSAPQFESSAMQSTWLWIHVGMAKAALASLVLGASVSAMYLRGASPATSPATAPSAVAAAPTSRRFELEELSVRFISVGFLLLAVVIAAGALWANRAWGNYWSWDPIETWALATWLLYGVALHFLRAWHVEGNRWAWLNLATLTASVLLFLAMRLVTLSPHWIYLGGPDQPGPSRSLDLAGSTWKPHGLGPSPHPPTR